MIYCRSFKEDLRGVAHVTWWEPYDNTGARVDDAKTKKYTDGPMGHVTFVRRCSPPISLLVSFIDFCTLMFCRVRGFRVRVWASSEVPKVSGTGVEVL